MKTKVNQNSSGISHNLIRKRIQTIAQEKGLSEQVQSVLVNLFDYMIKKQRYGCCHAFSSVLYVALCELGESPQLCIGECFNPKVKPFDHSWILLNRKVIDIAIYMPLSLICNSVTGVVVMDVDTVTQSESDTKYGYKTGFDFHPVTYGVINTPFVDYMDAYPFEQDGLWSVVRMVLPDSIEFDIDKAKVKYADTKRIFFVKDGEDNVPN